MKRTKTVTTPDDFYPSDNGKVSGYIHKCKCFVALTLQAPTPLG